MLSIPAFCITLPEQPERKEKAKAHFKERGLQVTFFDGIHATRFGLNTVFPYEVDVPGSNYNMGAPRVGCWLSHFMLWSALNLMWDDHFLVFEDDVEVPHEWHVRFSKAMADVPPDFDMLYVGSCCCEGKPQKLIAGEVFSVDFPQCTHAMVIAKKALPVLIKTQRKCYAPIDISMNFHSHPQMKIFTVLPRIFSQHDTIIPP